MADSDSHVLNAPDISVKNFYKRWSIKVKKYILVCTVKCDEYVIIL